MAVTDYQSKQNRKKKQTNQQACVLRVYFTNFKKNIQTSIALTSIIQILFSNLIFFWIVLFAISNNFKEW